MATLLPLPVAMQRRRRRRRKEDEDEDDDDDDTFVPDLAHFFGPMLRIVETSS